MENSVDKLVALINKKIVNYQNKVDQKYKLDAITGKAFEVFYEMSPELDYTKLDDNVFCDEFLEKVRREIKGEDTHVPDPPDPTGEKTGESESAEKLIDSISQLEYDEDNPLIKTPVDFEEGNIKLAILLIEKFFSLPVIEKEAYKVRIKKKEIQRQIDELKKQVKIIKGDERLINETKIENRDIREIETDINELEKSLYFVSPMQELFSETAILSFQRRAFMRVKHQWKEIIQNINEEVLNNLEEYSS